MRKSDIITVERQPNGEFYRLMPDGSKQPITDETNWATLKVMSEAEIEAGALSDPDNKPLSDKELKDFEPIPNLRKIREKLHFTQEQFSASFHVPLGTLRDWEQGAKQPDTAARSYLRVIEKAPHMVIQALQG